MGEQVGAGLAAIEQGQRVTTRFGRRNNCRTEEPGTAEYQNALGVGTWFGVGSLCAERRDTQRSRTRGKFKKTAARLRHEVLPVVCWLITQPY